jgi:hypothetical protein
LWILVAVCVVSVGLFGIAVFVRFSVARAQVTGKLSKADVVEIRNVLLAHRAPLLSRDFSSRGIKARIRERLAGEIVSISSEDGEYARAEYRDRWNDAMGYSYDLHRLTNGWKIVGVGTWKRMK